MILKRSYFVIILFVALTACSDYNKLLKSTDYELKLQKGIEYFGKRDWERSQALLEEVLPLYRTSLKGEEAYYKYCYTYYNMHDYYLAGYYFKSFSKFYPGSAQAEECLFMSGVCNLNNSPRYSLDQTETQDAIRDFQVFLDRYPESNRRDTCNKIIDNLRFKLEKKAFENAKLYYKIQNYKSASIALAALIKEYPRSFFREEAMFLILKSDYLYADLSIEDKKLERYEQTIKSYLNFAAQFPNSKRRKEAERIHHAAESNINLLKK